MPLRDLSSRTPSNLRSALGRSLRSVRSKRSHPRRLSRSRRRPKRRGRPHRSRPRTLLPGRTRARLTCRPPRITRLWLVGHARRRPRTPSRRRRPCGRAHRRRSARLRLRHHLRLPLRRRARSDRLLAVLPKRPLQSLRCRIGPSRSRSMRPRRQAGFGASTRWRAEAPARVAPPQTVGSLQPRSPLQTGARPRPRRRIAPCPRPRRRPLPQAILRLVKRVVLRRALRIVRDPTAGAQIARIAPRPRPRRESASRRPSSRAWSRATRAPRRSSPTSTRP